MNDKAACCSFTAKWLWQCYDTDSYSAERHSIVCHHFRTVTLRGNIRLDQPEVMVGCSGVQRLFILEGSPVVNDGPRLSNVIYRIDPVSGVSEHSWLVDPESEALSVAGNDQLLLAMHDRIEQYDTMGQLVRVTATGLEPGQTLHEALLLPDSMITCSSA